MIENCCVSGESAVRITPADDDEEDKDEEAHPPTGEQMAKKTKRVKILPKVQRSRYLDILEEIESSSDGKKLARRRCKISSDLLLFSEKR